MSRGLGRVQRALLVALNQHGVLTTPELAVAVYDPDRPGVGAGWHRAWMVEEAQMSAVRRALADLARKGFVHQCAVPSGQHSARWRRG
jgi:hypothetical protein